MRDDQKNIDDEFSDQTEFVSLDSKETLPKDELVDEVAEAITAETEEEETTDVVASAESEETAEQEEEFVEEKVKDEIDIQIDLLNDSEWVVRREAIITLGEMGDERCIEPIVAGRRLASAGSRDRSPRPDRFPCRRTPSALRTRL
jgi:HEAT repeat protein